MHPSARGPDLLGAVPGAFDLHIPHPSIVLKMLLKAGARHPAAEQHRFRGAVILECDHRRCRVAAGMSAVRLGGGARTGKREPRLHDRVALRPP